MKSRSAALQAIEGASFDVCVIGGGATGAGCAWDAQLRRLKTVLLEAGDFAGATSSASTKLVHGGVRYLQEAVANLDVGQYRVVKRALHERRLMLDNAPYLAHPLEILVPCYSKWDVLYYRIGLRLYDWIAGRGNLFPSRHRTVTQSVAHMPMLNPEGLKGTVAYGDGQFDDARYDLALLQSFTAIGGAAVNYARVVALEKDANGKLAEAEIEDTITPRRFKVKARAFVNATGPFSDHIREMARPGIPDRLRLSKGVHILLPLDSDATRDAILIPKTDDGRVIFAIPWLGRLLVGTTDDEVTLDAEMAATKAEAEYLLHHLNRYTVRPFRLDQIVSAYAGMRPLVRHSDAGNTSRLIRDHEIEVEPKSGLISVLGGKWTTHRAMAEDAIDAVVRRLGLSNAPCRTAHHPLEGSQGYTPDYWKTLADRYELSPATAQHLAEKFGTRAIDVLAIAAEDPRYALPLVEGLGPLRAEAVYSVRHEMAQTIEDVLGRRIGLQLFSWKAAMQAALVVGEMLAESLNWSETERNHAVQAYGEKIVTFMQKLGVPSQS